MGKYWFGAVMFLVFVWLAPPLAAQSTDELNMPQAEAEEVEEITPIEIYRQKTTSRRAERLARIEAMHGMGEEPEAAEAKPAPEPIKALATRDWLSHKKTTHPDDYPELRGYPLSPCDMMDKASTYLKGVMAQPFKAREWLSERKPLYTRDPNYVPSAESTADGKKFQMPKWKTPEWMCKLYVFVFNVPQQQETTYLD